jgi:hypothetical protein
MPQGIMDPEYKSESSTEINSIAPEVAVRRLARELLLAGEALSRPDPTQAEGDGIMHLIMSILDENGLKLVRQANFFLPTGWMGRGRQ